MGYNIKTMTSLLGLFSKQNEPSPIMFRGRHGIGKTAFFEQLANKLGYEYIAIYGSQLTEGDLLGIPQITNYKDTDKKVTTFAFPEWVIKAQMEPCVLVFEEIDRADPQVRKSFMQLACQRQLWNLTLHPKTVIAAAINGGPDGEEYQVGSMDPAELDRWTVFDFTPDTAEWLEWAKSEASKEINEEGKEISIPHVHPFITDFFAKKGFANLEHLDGYEPDKVYPSRRSWHRLSNFLSDSGLLNSPEIAKSNAFDIEKMSAGFVGDEAAVSLGKFLQTMEVITIEEIAEKGKEVYSDSITEMQIIEIFEAGLKGHYFNELIDNNRANSKKWKAVCQNISDFLSCVPREAFSKVGPTITKHLEKSGKFEHNVKLLMTKSELDGKMMKYSELITQLASKAASEEEEG